jgi:ectoine hydroxylase-related dioxygenase (phytanoyl-CoA dioxygenase family)
MVMFSHRGSNGQSWHQDCPPEDKSQFNLNRLVYSMDIDTNTGGQVVVIPGTHKMGPISVGDANEEFAEQIILSPKKGTLILIHGHLWHRVMPATGSHRASTNYRCCPSGAPADITDVCVYRNMRYQFSSSTVIEERLP